MLLATVSLHTSTIRLNLEPMRKWISLVLIITFLAPAVASQQLVRDKTDGKSTAAKAQRKTEETQRKAQALDILKGVVESAAEIQETQTRVAVLTGALDLLWKHDEAYARANFIKSAAVLSDKFASDTTQRQERSEIRASMGVLVRAFARHDPKAATRLLDKFQKVLEAGVPGSFPAYLNELEQRDAAAAASLFRVALSILASGRVYNPVQVTVL